MEPRRKPRKPRQQAKAPPRTLGVTLLSAGAAVIGIGGAIAALLLKRRPPTPDGAPAAGHPVPDLAPGATVPPVVTTPDGETPAPLAEADRAPDHFRPDPTAVPSADEREALRPATGPAPGFAADRGSTLS